MSTLRERVAQEFGAASGKVEDFCRAELLKAAEIAEAHIVDHSKRPGWCEVCDAMKKVVAEILKLAS